MIQLIQINEDSFVRFLQKDDVTWFVASDICAILGGNVSSIQKCINNTCFLKEKLPNISGKKVNMVLINCDGIRQVYQRSRSMNLALLMDKLSYFVEPNIVVYACKKTSWLRIVKESFSALKSQFQYPIGDYKIDLYFPDLLIAVECDENGHSDRTPQEERSREKFIQAQLHCDFIRFNPDTPEFNIGKVIDRIFRIFCMRQKVDNVTINHPNLRPKGKKRVFPKKECTVCHRVKELEEFNTAQENADGRENVCKICREKRQEEIREEKRRAIPENYTEKKCCRCNEILPLTHFFKDAKKFDGLAPRCKTCFKNRSVVLTSRPKMAVAEKTCSCCKSVKAADQFYTRTASIDGLAIYCISCAKEKAKKQYQKNHEQVLENKRVQRRARNNPSEEVSEEVVEDNPEICVEEDDDAVQEDVVEDDAVQD
jgi:very-short-patch-repair endonuclease